jgi:meiotic recombination protein SPO11
VCVRLFVLGRLLIDFVPLQASFQTLINASFDSIHHCVLVCGRGYPDVGTRTLVRALEDACSAPQLALVDADPFGIEILLTYTVGSKAHAINAASVNARHLRWLGVHVDDAADFQVPQHSILPLTVADARCGERLLRSDALARCRSSWRQQVIAQLERGTKLEIQAIGEQQLPSFILSKIEHAKWL